MRLADELRSAAVPAASLGLWWLGQAGFAFKTGAGKVIYLDPCLSDAVERLHGFKRLSLPPIAAEEVTADWVVMTHEHTDHLDPDAVPVIARRNPACRFAAPEGCREGLERAGVDPSRWVRLQPNAAHPLSDLVIHTAPADHSDYAPSALALVLEFDGLRVLCPGDTSLRPGLFKPLYELRVDVALPCINGGFGNMNHIDAAMMVQQAAPRIAIPCHYWTFAEQGAGDPAGFLHACRHFAPEVRSMLLKPGEGLTVSRREEP